MEQSWNDRRAAAELLELAARASTTKGLDPEERQTPDVAGQVSAAINA